jgi:dihydrofolate reductase
MRELRYHVATTVDGFIGHEDGSVEGFVMEGEHATAFLESLKNDYRVVLMGRRTYEFGLRLGVTDPYPWLEQYVFSRTMEKSPDPNVELVSENVAGFVRNLKEETGKDIYLCGGAELAATPFAEGLIDEIVLKVNPVLFGSGIPLFSGAIKQTALELVSVKSYDNGVLLLRYRTRAGQ